MTVHVCPGAAQMGAENSLAGGRNRCCRSHAPCQMNWLVGNNRYGQFRCEKDVFASILEFVGGAWLSDAIDAGARVAVRVLAIRVGRRVGFVRGTTDAAGH